MIYECNICQKLVYLEEEFVDHIKEIHLSEIEDEVVLISELITFYSELKAARRQESLTQQEVQSSVEDEFYGFYGDNGELLIFAKENYT